jgi:hypothetical membrane protein
LSSTQQYTEHRPTSLVISGVLLALVGIFGFIDAYLIVASLIFYGWFIVGVIALVTLATGIALIGDVDWAWAAGTSLSVLNLIVGFIELLGAFNSNYIILGWVGIGQALGGATIIFSAVALYLLYRKETRLYFEP